MSENKCKTYSKKCTRNSKKCTRNSKKCKTYSKTYHDWKNKSGKYHEIKGFCKSATLEDIEKHKFVLTPGRYVGIPDDKEEEVSFEDRMSYLIMALGEQMREGQLLDEEIKKLLAKVGFSLGG